MIQKMRDIDAVLVESDGLKWFNYLYLSVTLEVQSQLASRAIFFSDMAWTARLDVTFANLYFAALAASQTGSSTSPDAWRPLLNNRTAPGRARIQYALAGMNAHINRDLVVALLGLYKVDGAAPSLASARFGDYTRVNQLLQEVELRVRATLLVGTPLENGGTFEPLEDIIANWSVVDARQAAWDHSQAMWGLQGLPIIQNASLDALDGLTELAGNGLMCRVMI
ncbi:MAG TPA: DUF5995 family protein [Phycisphaerae bacterium]